MHRKLMKPLMVWMVRTSLPTVFLAVALIAATAIGTVVFLSSALDVFLVRGQQLQAAPLSGVVSGIAPNANPRRPPFKLISRQDPELRDRPVPVQWDLQPFVERYIAVPDCHPTAAFRILITSAPENSDKRQIIRDTWCSKEHILKPQGAGDDYGVQCVFLIGETPHEEVRDSLSREHQRHHDILQGRYADTYRNLTLKVLTGFYWTHEVCPSPLVLKTDDDCFVNTNVWLKFLSLQGEMDRYVYTGRVMSSDKETTVIRDADNKWAVSHEEYSPAHYPPYTSGAGYLLSQGTVAQVLSAARYQKPFPNEDAYVGLLLKNAGIKPRHSGRFSFYYGGWRPCNFLYFLVIHRVAVEQQRELMAMSERGRLECTNHAFPVSWD